MKQRLDQEVYYKKPGTFFRSIGTVLQFTPIPGHLKNKANQKNYKFSTTDTEKITNWLLENTEFTIFPLTDNFIIEKDLIERYCPLLNHTYNPLKLEELQWDREKCRSIARGG
ncbi:GIY-YIG nuclease family protein [Christiangramia sp.]|uniref:GIY-YIG nuclease family protein n=1 Tax=Christiangramia sp. TaxID=1931228 RepID=UPI00345BF399